MARECILCCDLRENVTEREPNCLNFSFSCANFNTKEIGFHVLLTTGCLFVVVGCCWLVVVVVVEVKEKR